MNVITQEGLITDLRWWSQMKVDGDSIVLSDERSKKDEETPEDAFEELASGEAKTLVVAILPGEQPVIQDLFKDLNEGIRYSKEAFNVATWLDEREAS